MLRSFSDVSNLVILEPHADDALLSSSSILWNPEFFNLPKLLITLFSSTEGEKSGNECRTSERLVEMVPNLQYVHASLADYKWSARLPVSELRLRSSREIAQVYVRTHCTATGVVLEAISNCIQKLVHLDENTVLLCPLGIVHPAHILCREAVALLSKQSAFRRVLFYLDFPYYMTKYGYRFFELVCKEEGIVEISSVTFGVFEHSINRALLVELFCYAYPKDAAYLRSPVGKGKELAIHRDRFFKKEV